MLNSLESMDGGKELKDEEESRTGKMVFVVNMRANSLMVGHGGEGSSKPVAAPHTNCLSGSGLGKNLRSRPIQIS